MKIKIEQSTGEVVFHPLEFTATPEDGFDIVDATESDMAVYEGEGGGPFSWVDGALAKVIAQPPVPFSLTAWQAKAALGMTPHPQAGTFLVAAEAAIAAMPDGPEKIVVMSAWNNNANFERASPTILNFGAALGMSSDDLDNLFRLGGGLVV